MFPKRSKKIPSEIIKPFPNLKIDDYSKLYKVDGRFKCKKCNKMRKFFCYSCSIIHPDYPMVPNIQLPFKIDIIKHKQEVHGKSTSCHGRMIAKDYITIYEYPNIPDYEKEEDVVLVFVSPNAVDIRSLFKGCKKLTLKENYGLEKGYLIGTLLTKNLKEIVDEEKQQEVFSSNTSKSNEIYTLDNLPFKKAVFIDSTWKQCRGIYQDPRIQSLNTVIIQNRITKFWRKQKGAPEWFLSTIEAIHQLLVEFHVNAWGMNKTYYNNCLKDLQLLNTDWIPEDKIFTQNDTKETNGLDTPYNGQYDNLLFFFSFIYSLIYSLDDPNQSLPNSSEY